MRELCEAGFQQRCSQGGPVYRARLEEELEVIRETEFAEYFLIVWDIIKFAHDEGIMLGVRGSAAASLVLYCLDITVADPIVHSLVFERFLNKERKEMPDIDMDFQDDRRDDVMRYVVEKYGHRNVAQIITFSRYGVKSALRNAGRAMGLDPATRERVTAAAPDRAPSIADAVDANSELKKMADANEDVARLLNDAQGLEGVVSHTSSHPAGVVISSEPLDQIAPLQEGTPIPGAHGGEDTPIAITQYSMDPIAKLGLLKMDFLALTNLTVLDQTIRMIDGGPEDVTDIPLDDPDVYQLLSSGETKGVFQLESGEMQRYIRELRPSNLADISAMIALYRPGPMDNIDKFIRSKHGMEQITFPHPSMSELLAETYGVIVYQDQVLQILQSFAGYTMGSADIVRKAMGKKIPKLMKDERDRFVEKAGQMGHTADIASEIFDIIEPFAGYAFNKAHSVSYALISYWTAWFKAHHPAEFMTATINCRLARSRNDYKKAIDQARSMRIPVLGPNVNESDARTTVNTAGQIRLGLTCVAGLPDAYARAIEEERQKNGSYDSLGAFCGRSGRTTAKAIEMLAKAGALDDLDERGALVENAKLIAEQINSEADARGKGQLSMFGAEAAVEQMTLKRRGDTANQKRMAEWEHEALSTSVTWDPEELLSGRTRQDDLVRVTEIEAAMEEPGRGGRMTVVGFIESKDMKKARDGDQYTVIQTSLIDGTMEITLWRPELQDAAKPWGQQTAVRAHGVMTVTDRGMRLNAERIQDLDDDGPADLIVRVRPSGEDRTDIKTARTVLSLMAEHEGGDRVYLQIEDEDGAVATTLEMAVLTCDGNSEALIQALSNTTGVARVERTG